MTQEQQPPQAPPIYGRMGKVLHVDLTTRRTWVEEPSEEFYRTYMGGAAMIGYYLLKEVPAGADPLGPENRLIFTSGVLTGLPASGAGRHGVGAKSPLSGGYGKSEVGGFWGSELKFAGWDAVVIQGIASEPVYLSIIDDQVTFRDASHLWGQEVLETERAIQAELNERRARVACIGPAGEKMVRYAAIMHDLRSVAGRMGLGAVMGAKKLKAVAVRGHTRVPVAKPEVISQMAKAQAATPSRMSELGTGGHLMDGLISGNLPVRNFSDGTMDDVENDTAARMVELGYRVRMDGCYACAIRCKKVMQVGAPWNVRPEYGGPEYETLAGFGPNCGITNLEAIMLANQICNAQGLDTISASGTIAFAMDCFENGVLTKEDTGGLDLRFGNAEAMLDALRLITQREGIGDLLAEGSRGAAAEIGRGAEKYAVQVKGVESGLHDPRLKPGMGLVMGINPIGMDHMVGMGDTQFVNAGRGLEKAMVFGFLSPIPAPDLGPNKARLLSYMWPLTMAVDSLLLCQFVPWTPADIVALVEAATGWKTSLVEMAKLGERAIALGRLFNAREGMTPDDDVLPWRMFNPTKTGPHSEHGLDKEAWLEGRRWSYEMLGYDPATGLPTDAKLADLGLLWAKM